MKFSQVKIIIKYTQSKNCYDIFPFLAIILSSTSGLHLKKLAESICF